jgi:hypothetical protein
VALASIEKRLRALEQILFAGAEECNCRVGRKTIYHNAVELARIMAMSCPVHSIRHLGEVMWVGRSLPLRRDDQQFCSCPPSPLRELLLGRRGPLNEAEQREQKERWMREYGPSSNEQFRNDQDRVTQLFRVYDFKKSLRRN